MRIGIGIGTSLNGNAAYAPFDPTRVTSATLRSYYDGDVGVTPASGKASAWADQGPDAKNLTQANTARQMTILLNYRKGHTFLHGLVGDTGMATGTVTTIAQPVTMYFVAEWCSSPPVSQQRKLIQVSGGISVSQIATAMAGPGATTYAYQAALSAGLQLNDANHAPTGNALCLIKVVVNGASSSMRIIVNGGYTHTTSGAAGANGYSGTAFLAGMFDAYSWERPIAGYWLYAGAIADGSTDDDYITGSLCSDYSIVHASYRTPRIACVGNSLTYGTGGGLGDVPSQLQRILGNAARCDNWGHNAYRTPQLTALIATEPMTSLVSTECAMYLWEGGNDLLSGTTPAAAWANYVTFLNTARSLGWNKPIITNTIGPRSDVLQATIDSFNALVVANWASAGFDACDTTFGADPALATPANADGIHYGPYQNSVVAGRFATVIGTLSL